MKSTYEGELRDKILTFFTLNLYKYKLEPSIVEDAITTISTDYCIKSLNEFYEQNMTGKKAFDFSLPDIEGKTVSLNDFKGKVVFMDFWYNGCGACIQYYEKVLSKLESHFKDDPNIVFVTVSIDADWKKWLEAINSGQYTSPKIINLYTAGKGINHPIIKHYRVTGFPRPLLIDAKGRIFTSNVDDLRGNGIVQNVIKLINKAKLTNDNKHLTSRYSESR